MLNLYEFYSKHCLQVLHQVYPHPDALGIYSMIVGKLYEENCRVEYD